VKQAGRGLTPSSRQNWPSGTRRRAFSYLLAFTHFPACSPGRIASHHSSFVSQPASPDDSQLPPPHLILHPSSFILILFPQARSHGRLASLLAFTHSQAPSHGCLTSRHCEVPSPLDCFANARNDAPPTDSPDPLFSLTRQPYRQDAPQPSLPSLTHKHTCRDTRQPSRLHSLPSLIAGTLASPLAFTHSQAILQGHSQPPYRHHCSLLIAHSPSARSPGQLATLTQNTLASLPTFTHS
jgi:hypothetical protein